MYRPAGWSCSKWNLHETAGYGAPVAWAVKNGITKGVGSVLFAPLQMKRGTMPLWVQECPDCSGRNTAQRRPEGISPPGVSVFAL